MTHKTSRGADELSGAPGLRAAGSLISSFQCYLFQTNVNNERETPQSHQEQNCLKPLRLVFVTSPHRLPFSVTFSLANIQTPSGTKGQLGSEKVERFEATRDKEVQGGEEELEGKWNVTEGNDRRKKEERQELHSSHYLSSSAINLSLRSVCPASHQRCSPTLQLPGGKQDASSEPNFIGCFVSGEKHFSLPPTTRDCRTKTKSQKADLGNWTSGTQTSLWFGSSGARLVILWLQRARRNDENNPLHFVTFKTSPHGGLLPSNSILSSCDDSPPLEKLFTNNRASGRTRNDILCMLKGFYTQASWELLRDTQRKTALRGEAQLSDIDCGVCRR